MRCNEVKKLAAVCLCGVLPVLLCACGDGEPKKMYETPRPFEVIATAAEGEYYDALSHVDDENYLLVTVHEDEETGAPEESVLLCGQLSGGGTVLGNWPGEMYLNDADWIPTADGVSYNGVLQSLASGDALRITADGAVGFNLPTELQGYSKVLYAGPGRWLLMRDVLNLDSLYWSSVEVYFYDEAVGKPEPVVTLAAEGLNVDCMPDADGAPRQFLFMSGMGELTIVDAADGSSKTLQAGVDFPDPELWRRYRGIWAVPGTDLAVLKVNYNLNSDGDNAWDYQMLNMATGEIVGAYTLEKELNECYLLTADEDTLYFAEGPVSGAHNRLVSVDLANGEETLLFAPVEGDEASRISDIRDVALLPDGSGILLMTAGEVLLVSPEDELQDE